MAQQHPNPVTWRPKPETRILLDEHAKRLRVSRAVIMHWAIEQYLAQQAKTPIA